MDVAAIDLLAASLLDHVSNVLVGDGTEDGIPFAHFHLNHKVVDNLQSGLLAVCQLLLFQLALLFLGATQLNSFEHAGGHPLRQSLGE